jgi:hypothetical protein
LGAGGTLCEKIIGVEYTGLVEKEVSLLLAPFDLGGTDYS